MKYKMIILSIGTLIIAMISIQAGASLAKQLFSAVGATGATTLRLILAAVILFVLFRPYKMSSFRNAKAIALYGVSLGLMNLSFYHAIERIPLGVAVALEFTGPLAVALFSSKKLGDIFYAILAAVGIYLVLPTTLRAGSDIYGIGFALLAGLFWALYIVFGKKAGALMHQGKVTALGMICAALTVMPFGVVQSHEVLFNAGILPLAFLVAILSSAIPYTLEMSALRDLPQRVFGTLMSLEPAIAALIGFVVLGESLALQQVFAILCIITASAGSAFSLKERV